jgi:pyruvate/2-oxoglutarate dehydrogenase complex dihydrolipoamide acyltransferase (E2) component
MAKVDIRLAQHGMGMTDGEVTEIHKHQGDLVRVGETIMVVEVAKAQLDIDAPVAGTVAKLCVGIGDEPMVGDTLAVIETHE